MLNWPTLSTCPVSHETPKEIQRARRNSSLSQGQRESRLDTITKRATQDLQLQAQVQWRLNNTSMNPQRQHREDQGYRRPPRWAKMRPTARYMPSYTKSLTAYPALGKILLLLIQHALHHLS